MCGYLNGEFMILELAFIGIFVGFISGFFGIGGGTILVPILMYLGFDIKDAIGISVLQMVFSSMYGSYLNYMKGSLKVSKKIFFGIGGFIGGLGSGFVVETLSSQTLTILLLLVVLFAIYKFFVSPSYSDKDPIENRVLNFFIGMMIGLLAMSVGIGGSLLLTPIMVGLLHYDIKKAVSAALFFVVFSSLSGLISLSAYGFIDYYNGTIIGIASLIGVYFGITIAHKTNAKRHKNLILILNFIIMGLIVNKLIQGN
jgi:uncharacterized membrane protein YfcA